MLCYVRPVGWCCSGSSFSLFTKKVVNHHILSLLIAELKSS
uniref:Uncharacterized protein n=1 Tax=Arundo donax TaxID=35708 RepID=A0A0A9B453_ARUDO